MKRVLEGMDSFDFGFDKPKYEVWLDRYYYIVCKLHIPLRRKVRYNINNELWRSINKFVDKD